MSRPSQEMLARGREYIDAAIETQRRLGYTAQVPPDVYERAVLQAARAFRDVSAAVGRYKRAEMRGTLEVAP